MGPCRWTKSPCHGKTSRLRRRSASQASKLPEKKDSQVKVTSIKRAGGSDRLVAAAASDRSSVLRGLLNATLSSEGGLKADEKNEKILEDAKDLTESKIVVMEPRSFGDVTHCVKMLQLGTAINVNLTMLEPAEAQRGVDFIAGGTYALNGHQERIGESVFLFASQRFSVTDASDPEVFKAYVSELIAELEGSASPAGLLSEPKTHILKPLASEDEDDEIVKFAPPQKEQNHGIEEIQWVSLIDIYSLINSISNKTPVRQPEVFWNLLLASVIDFLGLEEELSPLTDEVRAHAVGEILDGFKRDKNSLVVLGAEGVNIDEDYATDEAIVKFLEALSVEIVDHQYKRIRDLLDKSRKILNIDYLDRASVVIMNRYFHRIQSQATNNREQLLVTRHPPEYKRG